MSLQDVTVDTNVLMHASNPNEDRFQSASDLVAKISESEMLVCIDEGFSLKESENRSLIGAEYLAKLVHGTVSFALIASLANSGRLKFVSRSVSNATRNRINQMISNRRDRTFLVVANSSESRVLVSHDFTDFGRPKRRSIQRELAISVVDAEAAVSLTA